MTEAPLGTRISRLRWIVAIWCAGGLFDASQTVLIMHAENNHHPWPPLFAVEFASWLPWVLATPLIIRLTQRFPPGRSMTPLGIGAHLTAFAVVCAVSEAWNAGLQVTFDPWGHNRPPSFVDTWSTNLLYQVLTFVIAYALILTVTSVAESRARLARQATETARLNEELSQAQMAALRRQMEPHFMFNTLNAIVGLVRDQRNEAAVNTLVGLSDFLRRTSDDSHRAEVSLAEEKEYLQRYLDLQHVRFGERLRARVEIAPEVMGARVPNLLLQPLVENAIKHGVAQRVAGGEVLVTGIRDGDALRLTVRNDAPSTPAARPERAGVGLDNLRTRLRILHGSAASLVLARPAPDQVEVVVTLPYREA
ncbi:histidine kinase [Phenylobacterium sp.]|uniref:sensor histidine kinase n=1 Tax=Phenylobacterium sp. TaxID=1871053 RepID=UPI0011F7929F|nr:histidine kinase [Phenylobacterium sp.]THD60818.1 MAG: sensor histidine kinase [Phenylobacterium sp.]